ncbi:MAG: hypothetical protein PF904_11985 [Kiritimatiellae bacterium]|jgi:hypothetical protein|nr:hypothetical protein [Kiritimatiellia bacterium]
MKDSKSKISRRKFVNRTALTAAAFQVVPRGVLGCHILDCVYWSLKLTMPRLSSRVNTIMAGYSEFPCFRKVESI